LCERESEERADCVVPDFNREHSSDGEEQESRGREIEEAGDYVLDCWKVESWLAVVFLRKWICSMVRLNL
jgi:hypothetical protein